MHTSTLLSTACFLAYANANLPVEISDSFSHVHCPTTLLTSSYSICPLKPHDAPNNVTFEQSSKLAKNIPQDTPQLSTWQYDASCANASSSGNVFCTFTSTSFASGRGISLVTTKKVAKKIASLPAFTVPISRPPLFTSSRPPPFEVRNIPGRGMGVVANKTIQRGDRLFAYPVIGIFHNDVFLKPTAPFYKEYTNLFEQAATQLPDATTAKLWALAAHEEDRQGEDGAGVVGRLNTNTFGEEFLGEEHSIVVPETARMNHDCRPNAMYYFDKRTLTHYTHAARTIYAGEEITITYIDPIQPYRARQAAIKRSWGFSCDCSLCMQSAVLRRGSDQRLTKAVSLIKELETFITYSPSISSPPQKIENHVQKALQLISLYEMERLTTHIGDAYCMAAYAYSGQGMEWEARRYAEMAKEAMLISEGPADGVLREMDRMSAGEGEGVKGHWSWGVGLSGGGEKEVGKGEVKSEGCGCGHSH